MTGLFRRLRARLRYRHFQADLQREIDVHRAMAEDERRALGEVPETARRRAIHQLGNITIAREAARGVWIAPWIESVWQDLCYAVRTSRRRPGFAVTTIGTLTIGIGLNTALFTAFNAHFLKPWPVADPDRVVLISHHSSGRSESLSFSPDEASYFATTATSFSALATIGPAWPTRIGVVSAGDVADVFVGVVSSTFFDVLGRRMALGRGFQADDNRSGTPRVAVISHGTWHRRFGGDPQVIGRSLYVNEDTPFTIIGVAATGIHAPGPHQHEAWILPSSFDFLAGSPVTLVGRMASGVDRATASAELTALHRQMHSSAGDGETRGVDVTSTSRVSFSGGSGLFGFGLVQMALAILLALACLNVANMQLARALARRTEIALRLSLGAGRGRIVRQLVTEATVLAGVAAMAAFGAVHVALRLVHVYLTPELIRQPWMPDTTVLLFAGAAGLLCTFVFGLVPALQSTRGLRLSIASTGTGDRARRRFQSTLLASQIALSAVLIVAASLLTRSLVHASSSEPGFDLDNVSLARITLPSGWTSEAAASFRTGLRAALDRSRLAPVGFVDHEPLEPVQSVARFRRSDQGDDESRTVRIQAMSVEALQVLRLQVVAGRVYDDSRGSTEIVVNETLARRFWPSSDAVGQTLVEGNRAHTVVGVVRDVRFTSFEAARPTEPTVYRPSSMHAMTMIVRTPALEARDELTAIVRAIDPRVTTSVVPLSENVRRALADERLAARIAWGIGALGLALAAIGVFGMFGYIVEARRYEIGIRLALGANRRQVVSSAFAATRWAILGGLGAGLLLSIAAAVLLRQLLFGLSPLDPIAYGAALAILVATALLATFIPVRRALRVDPAITLRHD